MADIQEPSREVLNESPAVLFHLSETPAAPLAVSQPESGASGDELGPADSRPLASASLGSTVNNEFSETQGASISLTTNETTTATAKTDPPHTSSPAPTQTEVELKEDERLAEIVYAKISDAEAKALRQLCLLVNHLKDNPHARRHVHPFTLVRFLRARSGDVVKASHMFDESMRWRTAENIDERVVKWNAELQANQTPRAQLVNKFWFMAPLGRCTKGVPVLVSRVGRSDPGGLDRECGWEAFMLQHVAIAEFQIDESRRLTLATGQLLLSFVAIYDMAGGDVPKWTARAWSAVDPFKKLAPILDLNYPERLARAFIVNVPWAFKMFWSMFTPIIPRATLEKLTLHRTAWVADMTSGVQPWMCRDQIPVDLLLDGASVPSDVEAQVLPKAGIVSRGLIVTDFGG